MYHQPPSNEPSSQTFGYPQQPGYPPQSGYLPPQQYASPPPSQQLLYTPVPQTQMQPPIQPKKPRRWPWVVALIIVFFVGYSLGSAGSRPSTISSNSTNNDAQQNSLTSTSTIAKIGNTIILDGISCMVTKVVSVKDTSYGIGYNLQFYVKIVNKSSEVFHYNTLDFHLKNSQGQIVDPSLTLPFTGALAPNGQDEGVIFFDNIENPEKAVLLWQPTGHRDELTHYWVLDKFQKNE